MSELKERRCCCGKVMIEGGLAGYRQNDIVHEPLGVLGAFCGPEYSHTIRDLREINTELEAELAATKAEQLDLERIAWALSHGWKVSRTLNCEDFEKGWAEWVDPKGFNYPVHFTNWAKNDLPPLTDELREAIDKARAVDKGGGA